MKLSSFFCAFALFFSASATKASFKPLKISYESLDNDDFFFSETVQESLMGALHTVGMVTITDIPGMKALKERVLSWDLHACAKESSAAKLNRYPDGTERLTLATHTLPGGGAQKFDLKTDSGFCKTFSAASDPFRETVARVTEVFASRLSSSLALPDKAGGPLLMTKAHYPFNTLADIVENGEHLEHFHSYQHVESLGKQNTIDLHTDQGLFLVFSPGRIAQKDRKEDVSLATGFVIELLDGSHELIDFDKDDDLAVVMGDGVNQYVNSHLAADKALRALPHALAVPELTEHEARVWYGRMVLPPSSAIHPLHEKTFGDLRQELVEASASARSDHQSDVLSLGCSSASMLARQLEDASCEADTLMCWHRCMSLAEYNVSQEICAEQGKEVFCVNPRGQLWDGSHGDFYPGCATNDTEVSEGTAMFMKGMLRALSIRRRQDQSS
jgi:hypothetical protein